MTNDSSSAGGFPRWLIVGAIVVAFLLGLSRLGAGLIDLSGSGSGPNCDDAIAWDQARNHIGEQVTVRGPVVDTNYARNASGQPTFLNLGRMYPDPNRLTVVIWGDMRPTFDQRPEVAYLGQEICVSGEIEMYEGAPEIELDGPDSIRPAE